MNPIRFPASPTYLGLGLFLASLAGSAQAQMQLEVRPPDGAAASTTSMRLESENIAVAIDEQHATTTLTQRYLNTGTETLEGVCSVRAGQNSSVQGFAYWNGATKIRGEVFEKQAAQAVYEQTTGLRRDPGLLEQTGEGAFTFRVFPIQPKESKRIEVTLVQRLVRESKHVEYRVPLASPDATVSVTVSDSRPLGALSSPTHDLTMQASNGTTAVRATPKTKHEKEFVLRYDVEQEPLKLTVVKHQDAGQPAYLGISLATEAVARSSTKDVTIVLDHSGSMSGTPLDEARAAAKEIVSRLGSKDHLNVIAFDDRTDALYSQVQPVTDKNRAAALSFLDHVQAGGGTDIGRALAEALAHQRAKAERPIVLMLTDGESDAATVFSAAEHDHGNTRVFTIGLGTGVNRPLLSRLSDMKRGRFTYIQSAEAIRSSVSRVFSLVETAALEAPELSIENGQLTQMQPSTLPDIAPGEELFVTARALGTGPVRIVLKGRGVRGPIETSATVDLGAPSAKSWVGRLWARERTNRLLEDISLSGETDERKNEVIELSVSYGFVTPYTSFLAIPESELTEQTSGMMRDLRAKKQAILAKRPDAVALSRSEMPPGDPVLSVDAPADALRVTAYFPFGERELSFEPATSRWRVRFLVPVDTSDGVYSVPVIVIHKDGHAEFLTGTYTIDSREPEFEPTVQCRNGIMEISVATHEPVREVRAALVADSNRRVDLNLQRRDPSLTHYVGKLKVPAGGRVRIVVADRARNEGEEIVACPEVEGAR